MQHMVRIHGSTVIQKSVALSGHNLAGWMPKSMGKWSLGMGRKQPVTNYAQGVIQDSVYEANVSAATPDWCAVLRC